MPQERFSFGINNSKRKFRNRTKESMFTSLGFEQCEDRKMLSVSPGLDLGGILTPSAQQLMLQHLANDFDTAHLQQGANDLQLVQVQNQGDLTTATFQQLMDGLPVHGRYVAVQQDDLGQITAVENQSAAWLSAVDTLDPSLVQSTAQDIANQQFSTRTDLTSSADLVWFKLGSLAHLAWQVDSTVPGANTRGTDLHFVTVVDADTGDILSQSQTPEVIQPILGGVNPRIVINDDIGPAGSQTYALDFPAVVDLPGCTGTLVAPNVVVSARHCGSAPGNAVNFGPDSSAPIFTATVQSVDLPAGNGTLLDGGDFNILILEADVPDTVATPMRFIDATDELVGLVASTVGYGLNGVGSTGHGGSSDGLRWGGANIIDAYGTPSNATGANIISTDFDDGSAGANTIGGSDPVPLMFEATTAPGDSGGPVMVQLGSEWVIAGVLSGGTSPTSQYGDISWWTGTAIYRAEIEAVGGVFTTGDSGEVDVMVDGVAVADGGSVDFGTTTAGSIISKTFTVTNLDPDGDLELSEPITVPSGYTLTSSFGSTTLAPGASTTFTVQFDGGGFGNFVGEVSFESGDADESPFNFTVITVVSPPIGEASTLLVNKSWTTVFLDNTYLDPVVVAGPASSNEADPVTVRVRNITPDSFQIRIQEWTYQDREHASETVSYVVMESGTHRLADGTMIIADNTDGVSTDFVNIPFDLEFDEKPIVFTQTVTTNGGAPVVNRVGGVTTDSFNVTLQEEQGADNKHNPETVSWLAFVPSDKELGVSTQLSEYHERSVDENVATFDFDGVTFDETPVFLAGMQSYFGSNTATVRLAGLSDTEAMIWVQEEQSLNEEVGHGNESIGFLALDHGNILGQTIIGEAGHVENVTREWQTVTLNHTFLDPVIVLSVNSNNELDPGVARIRNVTGNSFEVHFEEWNYLDLDHAPETVSFVVVEAGIHQLRDGTMIEASNARVNDQFSDVEFKLEYDVAPVVFSQAATVNGPSTITTRTRNIDVDGFEVRVQEEEASETQPHAFETVGWIAMAAATGDVDGLFYEAGINETDIGHHEADVPFTNFFDDPPAVIANMQSYVGNNPATLRQSFLSSSKVSLYVEEERSLDNEVGHQPESIGFLAISRGLIGGYGIDFADQNDGGGPLGLLPPSNRSTGIDAGENSEIQQMMLGRNSFDLANEIAFSQFDGGFDSSLESSEQPFLTVGSSHFGNDDAADPFVDRNETSDSNQDESEASNDLEQQF